MKNQKGFGLTVVFLLIVMMVIAFVGSKVAFNQYQKDQPLQAGDRVSGVKNFDQCIKHKDGSIVYKNLGSSEHHINRYVGCQITSADNEQWAATNLDKCGVHECESLVNAFIHYCDNEYRQRNSVPPGKILKLGYNEDALVSGAYARGSIRCLTAEDEKDWYGKTPDPALMHKEADQWQFLMLITDELTCKDFDNKGIPPQITGNCFDETLPGTLRQYRIPLQN